MNDYIDDPELLARLNAPSGADEYVTDPELLARLNGPTGPQPGKAATSITTNAAIPVINPEGRTVDIPYQIPYPTGAGVNMAPVKEGLQTAGQIVKPAVQAAGQLARGYTNLGKLTTDVAMGAMGLPPPVAGAKALEGIQGTYANVQDYLNKSGQFAPKVAPTAEMANAARINQAIGPEGLANAMKPGATMPTAAPVAGGPAAQEGSTFIARMAQKFAPMSRAVAPVLNTAGRVAGPAGLAYNAYEAANYAQQAELGKRLAGGEGQLAQTAFRNMNTQYGAPITREQAISVLQSNNPRDIAAFGGIEKLRAIAGL